MSPYQGESPYSTRGQQPTGYQYQPTVPQPSPTYVTGTTQQRSISQQSQIQPSQQFGVAPQRITQQPQTWGTTQQSYAQQPSQVGAPVTSGQSGQQATGGQQAAGAQAGAPGPVAPSAQPGAAQQPTFGQPQQLGAPRSVGARPRLKPLTIEDLVQTDVVTAQRNTPIRTVAANMSQHEIGSVVVVEDDRPIGVLTDRKIALSLETTPDVGDRTASELLTGGEVVTATMDTNVFDALGQLKDAGVRRLPIVDENGRLEGIVTLDDILALLGSEINNAADVIRQQSPRF